MSKKAQIMSMDLVSSVLILLIIITAVGVILIEYSSFEEQQMLNRDMELKGQEAMNTLTTTTGDENWEIYSAP